MSKTITSTGEYNVKDTNEKVSYSFEYEQFDNLNDAIEQLGETKVLRDVQRMTKLDANNTSREKAKTENGHGTRKAMTEEQKAEAKEERKQNKALLDRIKNLSKEQREALGL